MFLEVDGRTQRAKLQKTKDLSLVIKQDPKSKIKSLLLLGWPKKNHYQWSLLVASKYY